MTRTSAAFVDLDDLQESPANIRSRLTNLEPLAASMRSVGVLQTLLVVPTKVVGGRQRYRVIEGHRRRAAAKMAGLRGVPCMVRHDNKTDETALMTVANLQREGLDPMDEARAFEDLRSRHTLREVAIMTGFSTATIQSRISLLLLPPEAQTLVREKQMSLGDATALARTVKQSGSGSARVGERRRTRGHFEAKHPLAAHVASRCTHHDSDRRLRGPGCEECWEATIRADALGLLDNVTPLPRPAQEHPVDESAVLRALGGDRAGLSLDVGDREEIVRRLVKQGRSDSQIAEVAMTTARTVERIRGRLGIAPAIPPSRPDQRRDDRRDRSTDQAG